jgi:hypothetical protein
MMFYSHAEISTFKCQHNSQMTCQAALLSLASSESLIGRVIARPWERRNFCFLSRAIVR